jgi:hypothetical protein
MPTPRFPTGTVSGESLGDRTFPLNDAERSTQPTDTDEDSAHKTDAAPDAPAERPVVDRPPTGGRSETDADGVAQRTHTRRAPSSTASPSRPLVATDSDLRERVARLERENEHLRRLVEQKEREQQDVIDRYERLVCEATEDGCPARDVSSEQDRPVMDRIAARLSLRDQWR